MSDNVHSLWGAAPPIPQVVPSVVEKLEYLLARAQEGRLVGFAYSWISEDGHGQFGWAGVGDRDRMIAGVTRLQHDLLAVDLKE